MMIFGSYIGKERALVGEGIQITLLDTFVAIMSGVIIFPACMSYNIPTDSGQALYLSHFQRCSNICQVEDSGAQCFSFL